MKISCAFPPVPQTADHVELAERLGYDTAWIYDTPALQLDVWMTLALAGARTDRIRLGPGVLIPSLRHPMVTAAAVASLVSIVGTPRVVVGVGAGFTGRHALGQRPLRWADVVQYVRDVRALLQGDDAIIDGARTRMLHWPGQAPARPISVEWFVAAGGPRGLAAARQLEAGVITTGTRSGTDVAGLPAVALLGFGTVLAPDESPTSARVFETAGPSAAVAYHAVHEQSPELFNRLPDGDRYAELVAAIPDAERHLRLHEGHLTELNELDRQVLQPSTLRPSALTCHADELPDRLGALAATGITEVAFQPMGDVPRELRAFADAARMEPS
ncbi:MAG TPA: LLM class flavin-dependent oxidoreductase [Acidimicrobiia bacterium]|nr:LLM class flavin-dependent oxidoreductase [Acidimicrobiia bacterium]